MRLSNATGLKVPTLAGALASALVASACATKPVETTYSGPPTVTSITFQDTLVGPGNAGVALPDVLVYSSTKPTRTTPTPPPSYSAIRVEFDRPLNGLTLANNNDLSNASFCSPQASPSVQLIDVAAANAVVASSVCYDPTSSIGQNPGVIIVPGSGALAGSTTSPFTCNSFTATDTDANGNVFKQAHQYALKFNAASIKDAAGNALSLPSTTGWTAGTFTFTTDDFTLMALGFQDQTNFFYNWFYKGYKGFEEGLDPLPAANQVICATNSDTTQCTSPAYDSPLLLYFSGPVAGDGSDVTVTRADGSNFDGAGAAAGFTGDPREIAVFPGLFWESGASYKVTIAPTLKGATGTSVSAADAKTFTFKVVTAPLEVVSVSPAGNITGQSYAVTPTLKIQEPVDPALIDTTHIQLLKGTTPVTATVAATPGSDKEQIVITPAARLDPETNYTIKTTGLKVAPATPNAGQAISDFTSNFTTATFRSNLLATSGTSGTNIDRSLAVNPTALRAGAGVFVRFTNVPTAATLTTASVIVNELNPTSTGGTTVVPLDPGKYTVTFDAASNRARIQITDTTYPLKYNQRYQIKLTTAITDSVSSKNLKAEGCTGTDCSDALAFRTLIFAPSLAAPSNAANRLAGKFTLNFNVGVKATSVNGQPATAFSLYKQKLDTDGITFINDGAAIPAPCTAVTDGATTTTCQPANPLETNKRYLISVVFAQSTPLQTADTIPVAGGIPTDPASNKFFGNRSLAFTTPCP